MYAERDADEKPYVEYLDAEARVKATPRLEHGIVEANASQTIFVPDVAFVSWEALRALPEGESEPRVPEIAVEIRSPSNAKFLEQKIARYLATGTLLVLDVDPCSRTVAVHDARTTRTFASHERCEYPGIAWLAFDAAELFEDLDRLP